jgi:F-type H+-transporting ATPase subunit a
MKKEISIKTMLIIFGVILVVLACFKDYDIYNHDTGKFFTKKDPIPQMQDLILDAIKPDQYVRENVLAPMKLEKLDEYVAKNPDLEIDQVAIKEHIEYPNKEFDEKLIPKELLVAYDEIEKEKYKYTYGSKIIYNIFKLIPRGEGNIILNFRMWRMIIYVDLVIILLAFFLRKKLRFIPSKAQIICEMVYGFIEDLVVVSLGEKNKGFVPYFITLFFFIWCCNWSSLLPIPGIVEPTRHLNVTLGLGVMSLTLVHFNSVRKKGVVGYIKGYLEPIFLFLPMNIVGELSRVISISFRLFGNIFGGAIITLVVTELTRAVLIPIVLNMFFTMFAGTIQAFVFIMLSLTYLSLEITD